MKLIRDEFVAVADDCAASRSEVPADRVGAKTIARLQYEFLAGRPYGYTLDELDWAVHVARRQATAPESEGEKAALLARGRPCMRASPLTKRYGWGAHYDGQGRIAIVAMESARYRELVAGSDGVRVSKAIRTKRA